MCKVMSIMSILCTLLINPYFSWVKRPKQDAHLRTLLSTLRMLLSFLPAFQGLAKRDFVFVLRNSRQFVYGMATGYVA